MVRGVLVLWWTCLVPACGARSGLTRGGDGPGADGDADADADADADGDCDAEPHGSGCPCDDGAAEVCYAGPDGTASVGECRAGVRVCLGARWSACDGEVLPREEECDDVDDDCDGLVDEDGVCPPCGRFATSVCFGPGMECRRWGDGPGLLATAEGGLTVGEAAEEGTWTGTVELDCVTGGFAAILDATATAGASIEVGYRGAELESELDEVEWIDLGSLPADGPVFDLAPWPYPNVAQFRTVLARDGDEAPLLRRLDVCWMCEFL